MTSSVAQMFIKWQFWHYIFYLLISKNVNAHNMLVAFNNVCVFADKGLKYVVLKLPNYCNNTFIGMCRAIFKLRVIYLSKTLMLC